MSDAVCGTADVKLFAPRLAKRHIYIIGEGAIANKSREDLRSMPDEFCLAVPFHVG